MGKPVELEEYDKYEVDGFEAYVRCDIQTKNDELKIKYSKIFFSEKLTVEGILF